MPGMVIRMGDKNVVGGAVLTGDATVRVGGQPVAVFGATIAPHQPYGKAHPPHARAKLIAVHNTTVRASGKPIAVSGDKDTCGHPHVMGSPTVRIG